MHMSECMFIIIPMPQNTTKAQNTRKVCIISVIKKPQTTKKVDIIVVIKKQHQRLLAKVTCVQMSASMFMILLHHKTPQKSASIV